jgi:predicted SprT family Zn-dependent metalloprotease
MELYRTLVEPDHVNCDIIKDAVDNILDRAAEIFGEEVVDRCGVIDLQYYEKGRNAAITVVGTHKFTGETMSFIQFSMKNVVSNLKQMIEEIAPHEVAHAICMANGWDNGHGKVWRDMSKSLGGDGATKNSMKVSDGRISRMFEAFSPTGRCVWLNLTQYKMAASSGIIVRDNEGNSFPLTKDSLTGKIIKV